MRIIIAGGTGFIGQALTKHFLAKNHELVVIGRDKNKIMTAFHHPKVTPITWDEFSEKGTDIVLTSDLVINLAGANIAAKRWTQARQHEILNSRVVTANLIAEACSKLEKNSPPLFNASAISIYGFQHNDTLSKPQPFKEDEPIDFDHATSFLNQVAKAWEKATFSARTNGVRVVNMRFALVLGKQGLLQKLYLPFKMGLGGPIGSGQQPFPWIALHDLIAAVEFLFDKQDIDGPINFASPQYITQREFAHTFANVLHRPSIVKLPASGLKLIMGKMAEELLLNGQWAEPHVLLSSGFQFKYPDLEKTLTHIYTES